MTDQIPADDLRRFIARYRTAANGQGSILLDELEALLPDPPRPTLADMTDEERAACRWMQADVYSFDRRMVITEVRTMCADLIERDGERWNVGLERVTPRPDLPRLAWPGDENPAPALPDGWWLADHKEHGRVIVTKPAPNHDGRVYFVLPVGRNLMGFDWRSCDPDELTYLDQGAGIFDTVPPNTVAVGSVWGDADALTAACRESGRDQIAVTDRDGDVSVWGAIAGWWETGLPSDGYEPYTIIHTGKEANQ